MGERPVYGEPTRRQHSMMMAGVWVESPAQARLLQRVLERGMQEFAGRHEETFLAKCHRELERKLARSKRESWIGWEYDGLPTLQPKEAGHG